MSGRMIKLSIDSREVEIRDDATVLQAAKKAGVYIPTLCSREELLPYGACRLCLVEICDGKKTKLTAACTFPVKDGISVITDSDRVRKSRAFVAELLLARCPNVPEIQEMAHKLGVTKQRLKPSKSVDEECILCGLCVRVCRESIRRSAIGFVNRGIERVVTSPFHADAESCIGCGACFFICPTGAVKMKDEKGIRNLSTWHTQRKLVKCKSCDNYNAPFAEIEYIKERITLPEETYELCAGCRRKKSGKDLGALSPKQKE